MLITLPENLSVCSHTFILFWLRKTSVIVETYQIKFLCGYLCFSSGDHFFIFFFGKSFFFLFLCILYNFCLRIPYISKLKDISSMKRFFYYDNVWVCSDFNAWVKVQNEMFSMNGCIQRNGMHNIFLTLMEKVQTGRHRPNDASCISGMRAFSIRRSCVRPQILLSHGGKPKYQHLSVCYVEKCL